MSDYANQPHALTWDDEISNDSGSFVLLEEGDYSFKVTSLERAHFPGSAKLPPCDKAIYTLEVETDTGVAIVKYDLILFSTLEWKISEFFRAIGQKKHGEPLRPRWKEAVGATGRARFKPRTYTKKDGTEGQTNGVERFYDYDPAAMQSARQAAQPQINGWTQEPTQSTPWDNLPF